MRLVFSIAPSAKVIPFNHQRKLVGRVHAWLGQNKEHDDISLYSIGPLTGGKGHEKLGGIRFDEGAHWFISFFNDELAKKVVEATLQERIIFDDLEIQEVAIQLPPVIKSNQVVFSAASPILVKKYTEGKKYPDFLRYDNQETSAIMTQTLRHKLKEAGINDTDVQVRFDDGYFAKAKTKLVEFNKIKNKANICPVVVSGAPESIQFAWEVGIGHSTGAGFGAVR